jgi:hypothetical protein
VDTDEKKQDWFLNGLNDGLTYALHVCDFINFQDMVDKALVLETRRGIIERNKGGRILNQSHSSGVKRN